MMLPYLLVLLVAVALPETTHVRPDSAVHELVIAPDRGPDRVWAPSTYHNVPEVGFVGPLQWAQSPARESREERLAPDSVPVSTPALRVMEVMTPEEQQEQLNPDYYRYRDVRHHHWVTIIPMTTMWVNGNGRLICRRYLNSDMAYLAENHMVPETLEVGTPLVEFLVTTQGDDGKVIGAPRVVRGLSEDRLRERSARWRGKAPPPPPLPRKLPTFSAETRPMAPSFTGRLPIRAADLSGDESSTVHGGWVASDGLVSVCRRNGPSYYLDWPLYSAYSDGDTLAVDLLGSDMDLAMRRLGLSDNTPQEYMVTVERYVIDRYGRKLRGPIYLGPMTKVKFDQFCHRLKDMENADHDHGLPSPRRGQ